MNGGLDKAGGGGCPRNQFREHGRWNPKRPRRNTTGVFVWLVKDWANGLAPRPASWPEKPSSITLNPKRAAKATLGGLKRIVAIGLHSIGWVVVGLLGGEVGNTIWKTSPSWFSE